MPAFAAWVQKHPEVKILSVSLDQSAANATAFLKETDISMALLLTDENQARNLGAQALPTTVIIDADGSVSQLHRGPRNWNSKAFSDQLLKSLLPEVESMHLHTRR